MMSDHDKIRQATVSMRRRGKTVRVFRHNGDLRIHPNRKEVVRRYFVDGYRIENTNDDALPDEWESDGFEVRKLLANHEFQIEQ